MLEFSNARCKIERARTHIAELERLVSGHIANNPILYEQGPGTRSGDGYVATPGITIPALPRDVSVILGDIIHNARTSLDLLASEMARANGKSDSNVYFPFGRGVEHLDAMISDRRFNRCGAHAVALLKTFKPYTGGNSELRALHDLDIVDKHRSLIPEARIGGLVLDINYKTGGFNINQSSEYYFIFPPDCALSNREIVSECRSLVSLCESIIDAFSALNFPEQ